MLNQSERLMLREFTESDFHLFYSVFSNAQTMKYTLLDKCNSEEELMPYFRRILKNNHSVENRGAYEYAVYLSANNQFIGFADIEIQIRNTFGGSGEIGYFLLPEFWGQGYATEISNILLEIGFKHLNLHRMYARCNSNNIHSERVMLKVGMKKEGEARKARFKNGQWDNELQYSILVDEWQQRACF